jgi:carbon monoxide dehydrogenase subunit G
VRPLAALVKGRLAMEHEHTQYVAASPDSVFGALADVSNLPRFVPQMTAASRGEGDSVTVEARYEGHTQEGTGWFRTDEQARRVEWGADGSDYHGWLQVNEEAEGSRLTLFLATAHGDAPDSEVMGTLDAIRRLVEAST